MLAATDMLFGEGQKAEQLCTEVIESSFSVFAYAVGTPMSRIPPLACSGWTTHFWIR